MTDGDVVDFVRAGGLVFDRTEADVDSAIAEIRKVQHGEPPSQSYLMGLKGCYNIPDLNRVESAVLELEKALRGHGYSVSLSTKTDWNNGDFLYPNDLQRYLSNLDKLKAAYYVFENTPQTPDNYSPYTKANDIEKILFDLFVLIDNMAAAFNFSGEIYAGEV